MVHTILTIYWVISGVVAVLTIRYYIKCLYK